MKKEDVLLFFSKKSANEENKEPNEPILDLNFDEELTMEDFPEFESLDDEPSEEEPAEEEPEEEEADEEAEEEPLDDEDEADEDEAPEEPGLSINFSMVRPPEKEEEAKAETPPAKPFPMFHFGAVPIRKQKKEEPKPEIKETKKLTLEEFQMRRRQVRLFVLIFSLCVVFVLTMTALTTRITTVEVEGSTHYTNEELIPMILTEDKDYNTFYAWIKGYFGEQKEISFVEKYKTRVVGKNTLRIIVYEKPIAGCLDYMDSYLYFDSDGIIVESTGEKDPRIPLVTGLRYENVVMYEPLTVEDPSVFKVILNIYQLLDKYGMEVDRINFDENNITLTVGEIDCFLGTSRNLAGKIGEFHDMIPQLKDLSGTVYLDGFSPDAKNPSYPFVYRK